MFGSHTVATINTLRSFSAAFRLPFVSTGLPICDPRSRRHRRSRVSPSEDVLLAADDSYGEDDEVLNYDVHMRPLYARAVVDLLKHYDCHQVWYLYNSNEGTSAFYLRRDNNK